MNIKQLSERIAKLEKLGVRKPPPVIDFKDIHEKVNKFERSGVSWPTGLHLAIKAIGKLELYDSMLKSLLKRIDIETREFNFRIRQLEDSEARRKKKK